jgi:hypothetical protein
MKHILIIEEFLNESYQRKLADEETTKKLFRFFEQVFYEIKDKRHDYPHPHQLEKLTPEAKEYLLDVLDAVKEYDSGYPRLGKFLDPQTSKTLTTEDELISYLASNFFSGFGRSSQLGSAYDPKPGLRLPEPPSQEVADSIIAFAKSR